MVSFVGACVCVVCPEVKYRIIWHSAQVHSPVLILIEMCLRHWLHLTHGMNDVSSTTNGKQYQTKTTRRVCVCAGEMKTLEWANSQNKWIRMWIDWCEGAELVNLIHTQFASKLISDTSHTQFVIIMIENEEFRMESGRGLRCARVCLEFTNSLNEIKSIFLRLGKYKM